MSMGRGWWTNPPDAKYNELEEGISALVDTYREHATLMAAIVDTSTYDAGVRAELHKMIVGGQREMAKEIKRGQESGKVRSDIDPERTAGWLSWMVEYGLHELVRDSSDAEAKKLAEALARILWNALDEKPA